ncbi:imidazolonepropionase [Sphingopyxis alaskensis]|jgi:imidazolonepropionase|uniref:Imidazolonepropionase n=1 Tax=Sphingopyxis alaskensis (strain DSM 13593 / LMG 18877 / RB2256) TaxID=317655 RepID=HUTI_SPHAL|nr:imidazolonepropionase [Sphingopyxis alaskensis]Q1GSH1.1 RecName: Full=Imidazolonepropionase; AltName: Full=Imidazolone-5-propionate hydrolase [Sphingopyxis alaskensis RB2256]ABF53401.1 imidazolonepropionase [Sphingopyxis alaskensis RB2256]MCM3419842.1 imidazolonepropionase [Sphingopyxis alaskensis]
MTHRRDTVQMEQRWTNARLATMAGDDLGLIDDGVVAAKDGRIIYAGPAKDAPATQGAVHDCEGRLITPGLIDCHTHLIHGGNRANEWAMRLEGASYDEIARAGGGIVSTMRATRDASEAELVASALPRLDALIAEGVTTIEIKSGYGLSTNDELKMLRAARALANIRAIRVEPTFLGAHALPPEYQGDSDAYIDLVVGEMIPAVASLATAVDAFCEGIGFSPEQCARVLAAAKAHGLKVKLHAEQLSALHGSALAARHGALSADHLEHATDEDVRAMAEAGSVAVLLPGAYYFMRETRLPPVQAMRRHGTRIALATDNNPGTSPTSSLLLMLNMGATLFGLTVIEALRGVTVNAAAALGLSAEIGTIEVGKACDLAIWDVGDPAELVYRIGFNPLHQRIKDGQ